MAMPLAPPATVMCEDVALPVPNPAALVTSNDIKHPEAAGQFMGAVVLPLACTHVRKTRVCLQERKVRMERPRLRLKRRGRD